MSARTGTALFYDGFLCLSPSCFAARKPQLLDSVCAARYSFGVVLWELLTGREPWEGFKPLQIMHMVAQMGKRLLIPEVLPHGALAAARITLSHGTPHAVFV